MNYEKKFTFGKKEIHLPEANEEMIGNETIEDVFNSKYKALEELDLDIVSTNSTVRIQPSIFISKEILANQSFEKCLKSSFL